MVEANNMNIERGYVQIYKYERERVGLFFGNRRLKDEAGKVKSHRNIDV